MKKREEIESEQEWARLCWRVRGLPWLCTVNGPISSLRRWVKLYKKDKCKYNIRICTLSGKKYE